MNTKLPAFCYSENFDGKTIMIRRGEKGYFTTILNSNANELNEALGISKAQVEAMIVGSIFSWTCPGADPDNYNEDGSPKK